MGMDMVTVELEGKDGDSKRFPIYKELLCRDSKFFKAALTGGFSELTSRYQAHRGVVKVKDTPEKTFRAFIQWLFTKDFVKTGYEEVIDYPLHELLDLFIFADFYDVPELRALVLERCARMTFDWTPEAVTRAYDRVPEDSEFIKKMVKRALWNWHPDAFEEEKDLYPPQFVWDVMARSLKNRKNWPEPSVLDDNVY
ncbi:hypothetical protein K490DRAFT_52986 [Saccharata proteae CBS 121410]|uniref:BTB domain-containing protein n=1 Tax=Saccharata proteae CBS 121410 TaxID=1314787 RepID=A0A9P4I4S4_9PEZI|nr:hypothetical protein K490DRAFT_52986 [Saccharata proteae CBS 121410]